MRNLDSDRKRWQFIRWKVVISTEIWIQFQEQTNLSFLSSRSVSCVILNSKTFTTARWKGDEMMHDTSTETIRFVLIASRERMCAIKSWKCARTLKKLLQRLSCWIMNESSELQLQQRTSWGWIFEGEVVTIKNILCMRTTIDIKMRGLRDDLNMKRHELWSWIRQRFNVLIINSLKSCARIFPPSREPFFDRSSSSPPSTANGPKPFSG